MITTIKKKFGFHNFAEHLQSALEAHPPPSTTDQTKSHPVRGQLTNNATVSFPSIQTACVLLKTQVRWKRRNKLLDRDQIVWYRLDPPPVWRTSSQRKFVQLEVTLVNNARTTRATERKRERERSRENTGSRPWSKTIGRLSNIRS